MKKSKSDKRRTQALAPDDDETDIFELAFNDEEETLSGGHVLLTHQRDMPALEEYLHEMSEIDSRADSASLH